MKRLVMTCVLCLCTVAVHADDDGNAKAPGLRGELLRRTKVDQDARLALIHRQQESKQPESQSPERKAELAKLSAAVQKADHENTAWLQQVVESRGWPTRSLVGLEGASAAWLLVQHADAEPAFQRKCLDLMVLLPRDEVSQADIAYLTDRVLLAEGKKQLYGTQFQTVDGQLRPSPLEDEANVDKRRAEMGLMPLAEYAAELAKVYGRSATQH